MIDFNKVREANEGEVRIVRHKELYCPRLLEGDCPIGMHKAIGEQIIDRTECCETLAHKYCSLNNLQRGES